IDVIDINEIGLKRQFEDEVERYNKFQHTVLRMHGQEAEIEKKQEFDIRTYAKYILREGRMIEKRELLASLKSRLVLGKDKKLTLRRY
ncbi:hypothetical protein, partial [Staphylococcus aureus]|uniref:hypothetical protein n=1 Tax=Staphylococcus aureus TaxID=1280 RepID=UPI0021B109B3